MLAQLSKFPNPRYADSHEAIAELLRVQVTALDSLKKKLGTPLGRQTKGVPQPFQAESWRSKASLSSLQAGLASAETVWSGVDNKGLRGLLPAEQKPLADKIDAAYADSQKQLAALKPPLVELLATEQGRQQLNAFYDSLNKALALGSLVLSACTLGGWTLFKKKGESPLLLSARDDSDGKHYAVGYRVDGTQVFATPVAQRCHDIINHPERPIALFVARRPGTESYLIDLRDG
nr:hypothetical protein [Tanacetum cinerariifolium]